MTSMWNRCSTNPCIAKYRNAGQVCVSPTRFYVHEKIYDRSSTGFTARARALRVGDGLSEAHADGAARARAAARAMESLLRTRANTVRSFHDRRLAASTAQGYFWQPTVLADVTNAARIMNEEPFGPVAILNPFSDFDSVIQQANRLPYGLAAYAFTRSSRTVNLLGEQIEAGMVGINSFAISVPESPFGGVKESGHGSEEGIEGLEACLVTKFVSEA